MKLLIIKSLSLPLQYYGYRGIDGHKKVNGRKRQLITDTLGRIWQARTHPANEHDYPAGVALLHLRYLIDHKEAKGLW